MSTIQRGDRVRLHYTTYSHDDCMIETSQHRDPLEFIAGAGTVIDGIERAVLGMCCGGKKRVPVMPEHAFGYRDPRWQLTAPRSGLPDRATEGDQLAAAYGGQNFPVWIRSLQAEEIVLDVNHPLAGETLIYELEVVGVESLTASDSVLL